MFFGDSLVIEFLNVIFWDIVFQYYVVDMEILKFVFIVGYEFSFSLCYNGFVVVLQFVVDQCDVQIKLFIVLVQCKMQLFLLNCVRGVDFLVVCVGKELIYIFIFCSFFDIYSNVMVYLSELFGLVMYKIFKDMKIEIEFMGIGVKFIFWYIINMDESYYEVIISIKILLNSLEIQYYEKIFFKFILSKIV